MSAEQLIGQFGYLALFVGAFFEGEAMVIAGAFAAHQGYLKLQWVITAAFLGAFGGDEFYFFLGRLKGRGYLERRPLWQMRVRKVQGLVERHRRLIILGFRFLYGLRTVTPFALGMSEVRTGEFVFFNLLGAAVWSLAVGCGATFEAVMKNARRYESWVILSILAVSALAWIGYCLRRRDLRRLAAARLAEGEGSSTGPEAGGAAKPGRTR